MYLIKRIDTHEYLYSIDSKSGYCAWGPERSKAFICETENNAQYYAELYVPRNVKFVVVKYIKGDVNNDNNESM